MSNSSVVGLATNLTVGGRRTKRTRDGRKSRTPGSVSACSSNSKSRSNSDKKAETLTVSASSSRSHLPPSAPTERASAVAPLLLTPSFTTPRWALCLCLLPRQVTAKTAADEVHHHSCLLATRLRRPAVGWKEGFLNFLASGIATAAARIDGSPSGRSSSSSSSRTGRVGTRMRISIEGAVAGGIAA